MNSERDKPDSGDDDRLVSMTYREIAGESAPDTLNRSVLGRAARAARPRYARNMSWMRPMAWAATVGLSLAIVLEITQVSQLESEMLEMSDQTFDSPATDLRRRDDKNSASIVEESVIPDTSSAKIESDVAVKTDAAPRAALQAPQRIEAPEKKRANEPELAMELEKASVTIVTDDFSSTDSDIASDTESIARRQSGITRELAPAVRAGYSSDTALRSMQSPGCDEQAIAAPAAWLECIEKLEKAGLGDAAGEELKRMKLAFPEYVLP